jgi:hypothetical protein
MPAQIVMTTLSRYKYEVELADVHVQRSRLSPAEPWEAGGKAWAAINPEGEAPLSVLALVPAPFEISAADAFPPLPRQQQQDPGGGDGASPTSTPPQLLWPEPGSGDVTLLQEAAPAAAATPAAAAAAEAAEAIDTSFTLTRDDKHGFGMTITEEGVIKSYVAPPANAAHGGAPSRALPAQRGGVPLGARIVAVQGQAVRSKAEVVRLLTHA